MGIVVSFRPFFRAVFFEGCFFLQEKNNLSWGVECTVVSVSLAAADGAARTAAWMRQFRASLTSPAGGDDTPETKPRSVKT